MEISHNPEKSTPYNILCETINDIKSEVMNEDNNEKKSEQKNKTEEDVVTISSDKEYSMRLKGDVYKLLRDYAEENDVTMKDFLQELVVRELKHRTKFQKFYAPNLSVEHVSDKSLFIHDSDLDKTVTIKVRWHKLLDKETGIYVFCELCDSESCLHVKYSLTLPKLLMLKWEGRISDNLASNTTTA